ncbi:MAG: SusC/RagA family TonB-linked outer membrane protein [Bacteroidales bacterium]
MKTFYLDKRRWRLGSLVSCLLLTSSFVYANDKSKVSESVFSSKEYNYSIQQNKKKPSRIVKGTVISGEDNLPIIGANVWVKNGTEGAITDIDGNYSIKVEGVAPVLTFSYVGMKSQDIAVGEKQVLNVTLSPDAEQLDEVVIVGYGSQKKESVVGAISTVDVTNLKIPQASVSNALAGQLAGIVAMTRSGEPGKGSSSEFYIRGVSSFKGTSKPLVLVDGIERELDLVDTDDIATFSILKDASASAVYGVRGANGVILITTRKGAEGKPKISVRAEAGITQPTKMPKMVNSMQWAELYNEALGREYYSPEEIQKYASNADSDLYPNVNWIDELYRDHAFNQRVNLNITGGAGIAKYYISGAFYNEGSIFKNAGDRYDYNSSINYNKFNFRANIDLSLTKTTTVNVNLANIYEKSFRPGQETDNIWGYTFNTSPNAFPVEYSDGTISAPASASGFNPWNLLVHSGYSEQFWNSSQSLIGINQDFSEIITPGLTAQLKFSWDAYNTSTQLRKKEPRQYHATGRDPETGALIYDQIYAGSEQLAYSRSTDGTMTTYLEGSINYTRLFAEKHRVGGLFLYNHKIHVRTQEEDKFKSLPYKNQGIAARATYAFADKYFAEFNMGYNGSENFARGHRFGFFPAGAIGWMMSNEKWWEPMSKSVDMLKLKASYGKVGNDAIGGGRRWMYEPTIIKGGSWNYGETGGEGGEGIRIGDVENLNVSWEEALKFNAGIEFSLFEKLKVQADYFKEHRTGIFLQRAGLPAIVGITNVPYTNIGETSNQGFDGTIEYNQKVGEVYLTARGNFTFNKNKLLNNDEPDWQYKYQNAIGKPFGSGGAYQPFGLVAIGYFESQEDIDNSPKQTYGEYRVGDLKYQDINGDGKIDTYDRIAIGYTNMPEIVYGFGMTANWKNFDVNVFFQGVSRVSFFTGGTSMQPFTSGNMGRAAINADVYDHVWKTTNTPEQNANALYPRLSLGGAAGSSNNYQASTATLRDGSFLRLKNVEIGYTLPKSVLKATFLSNFRVYMAGNNLATFSKVKLWDPEKGNGDGSGYPPSRIVSLGITANF